MLLFTVQLLHHDPTPRYLAYLCTTPSHACQRLTTSMLSLHARARYSNSIVAGGLLVVSYTTLATP